MRKASNLSGPYTVRDRIRAAIKAFRDPTPVASVEVTAPEDMVRRAVQKEARRLEREIGERVD